MAPSLLSGLGFVLLLSCMQLSLSFQSTGCSVMMKAQRAIIGGQKGGEETIDRRLISTCLKDVNSVDRRNFFSSLVGGAVSVAAFTLPETALANGLLEFPPRKLNNRYFLVRAGESVMDAEDLVQTHPIEKLNRDNKLTDEGVLQVERAADRLFSLGVTGGSSAFIYADISARAQETAVLLAQSLDIGNERVVPEFSFLEPRGFGALDKTQASTAIPAVHKMDAKDPDWAPPPNDDGTPHESVSQVFVRGRQLLSKLETQYFGEDVILVSPDSDNLSVLQAFALGEDLSTHSKHFMANGDVRPLYVSSKTAVLYTFPALPVPLKR